MNVQIIRPTTQRVLAIGLVAASLGGCLGGEDSEESSITDVPGGTNAAPLISGVPASSVVIGNMYSFTPTATDADGDRLTFSIENRPSWTSFDPSSGELSGRPTLGNVGSHDDIRISVSDGGKSASLQAFSIEVQDNATPGNSAPVISGTPSTTVTVGGAYSFTPAASDADGDSLTFSIQNMPAWASFSSSNGQLSGQPGSGDVGVYSNILISVSDGQATDSLPVFSIAVSDGITYSATLSWTAPTQNEDGSPLTDLAGYKLYWGTTPGSYTDSITVDNPGLTLFVVDNLPAGSYEFVATAYNSSGVESAYSNPASKTVP